MYNIYIPTTENMEAVFGSDTPICMTGATLRTYAREHDLFYERMCFQVRLATEEDIARWGLADPSMPPADFYNLWCSACYNVPKEHFIADAGVAYVWGNIGSDDPIPNERIDFLERLWDAAHMDIHGFAAAADMSVGDLFRSMAFDFPSAQHLKVSPSDISSCARIMLARAIGILPALGEKRFDPGLTPEDFWILWINAVDTPRKDHFIADNGMSYIWPDDNDLNERIAYLERLWDTAHMDLEGFAAASGMTLQNLCCLCGSNVPTTALPTLNTSDIPECNRVMLARAIGMI